jgi:hypothetical protein
VVRPWSSSGRRQVALAAISRAMAEQQELVHTALR